MAAGALVALAAVLLLRKDPAPEAPPAESFRIARLTATGKVIAAVVSGDGKFIAYVSSDQGLQSLWLRQIGSAQSLELVPPRRVGYWGLGFAPDGSIYYSVKDGEDRDGALYQISALGGNSRRILGGVDSGPTFSPDGKQVAFVRGRHPTDSQSALIIASSDGTGERTLAAVQSPAYFVPIFYTGPSWSPDGRQIAVSVIDRQKRTGRILGVDVKSGVVKTIAEGPWQMVANVVWTPHGDGLLAIAERGGDDEGAERTPRAVGGGMLRQVWFVPYPSGTPYQVTNDLFDYRLVSVSSDGKSLVTVASDVSSDLWLHATGAEPKRITAAKMDGGLGLAVMPDGRIVATSLESGKVDIWIMNSDGSGRTLLTRDPHDNRLPLVTPDGRATVYLSIESDGPRVCRMDPDGSGRRVLARRNGPDSQMAISPDGRFVVYSTTSPDGKNHLVLARVPIDGGEPQYLTNEGTDLAAYSPDGTRIAAYSGSQLVILPADGGSPLQRLDSPTPFAFSHLLWTPDGKSLLVNTMPDDRANLWQLPLDGSPPRKLTDFDERMVMGFAPLPDGKGWVFARGDLSRDAVMITGWRRGTAKR